MPKSATLTASVEYIKVMKDEKHVGNINGSVYTAVDGATVPKLKGEYEWDMVEELSGMGYELLKVRETLIKPVTGSKGIMDILKGGK